ncbi:MAG: hypothetical protein ACKVOE_05290 [Rickettsiales bacterium]
MVRRYFTSTRRNKLPQTLQDETLNTLRQQTDALLKQLTQQFARDLQAIQRQASRDYTSGGSGDGGSGGGLSGSFSGLFSAGAGYLFNRPKVTTGRGVESARSVDANRQFRLSQAQALAEASQMLTGGDKNR